jgi:hypothetical protein
MSAREVYGVTPQMRRFATASAADTASTVIIGSILSGSRQRKMACTHKVRNHCLSVQQTNSLKFRKIFHFLRRPRRIFPQVLPPGSGFVSCASVTKELTLLQHTFVSWCLLSCDRNETHTQKRSKHILVNIS